MTLGQGIAQGIQQFGQGLEQYAAGAAKAKALRGVVKAYAGPDDQGKALTSWADSASLPDLEGFVQGQAAKQALEIHQARLGKYLSQAEQRQQQVADEKTAGQFLQNYLNAPAPVAETPQARMTYAASNTPNMSGRILPRVMDSLARWEQVANPDGTSTNVQPQEATVAGKRVIYNPRTGNFQTVDEDLQPQAVTDEDGNLYGHQVPNGKGGFKFVPVKTTPTPRPTIPAGAKPVQIDGVSYFQDDAGNLYKAPTPAGAKPTAAGALISFLRGGATNAPTAKPAPVQEVTRVTADGRKAIFDANTKQFLRYAN